MRQALSVLFALSVVIGFASAPARAGWDDGYWHLEFKSGTSSTAAPVRVGVDLGDGAGFSFQTILDDDGDGVIPLPLVPVGGRLALGVDDAGGGVTGCDIWDLLGPDVQGGTMTQKPLLIVAEDIEGEALGVDYGAFTQPPFELTPGEQYTVTDGAVAGWPEPRFVNEFGVPGLEEFVQTVDSLPNFNGEVIVSAATLTGVFVPEPGCLALFGAVAVGLLLWRRR